MSAFESLQSSLNFVADTNDILSLIVLTTISM